MEQSTTFETPQGWIRVEDTDGSVMVLDLQTVRALICHVCTNPECPDDLHYIVLTSGVGHAGEMHATRNSFRAVAEALEMNPAMFDAAETRGRAGRARARHVQR
jgi:hypothetical protein